MFPKNSAEWPTVWYWERDAGVTKADENFVWGGILHGGFWAELAPLPGAIATLKRINLWAGAGHQFYFITTRPGTHAKLLTERWLMTYGITAPTVLIAENEAAKGLLAKGLGLSLFIDDKPSNCEEVIAATQREHRHVELDIVDTQVSYTYEFPCRVCLLDAPYNREYRIYGVERVFDVETVLAGMLEQEARRAA